MSKRLIKFTGILISTLAFIGLLVGSVQLVYAAGAAGNDPNSVPSSSNVKPGDRVFSSSRGASWVKYPVNGNNNIVIGDQRASGKVALKGGVLHGCVDDNAQYYFRLAYNWYVKGTNTQWLADQTKGVLAVRNLATDGLGGKVPSVTPPQWGDNAVSYDKAKQYFQDAKKAGKNSGVEWEDIGMFCWDPSDSCPPDDPSCAPPTPTITTASAHFYATSSIQVVNAADGVPAKTVTSDAEDKKAYLSFSTDQDSVTIRFWHTMYYVADDVKRSDYGNDEEGGKKYDSESYKQDDDKFKEDVVTSWSLSTGSSADSQAGVGSGSGEYKRSQEAEPKSDHNTKVGDTGSITVSMKPGESKKICQKIDYAKKNFVYKGEDIQKVKTENGQTVYKKDPQNPTNADGSTNYQKDADGNKIPEMEHDYWKWTVESSADSGTSEACVEIYRPRDSNGITYDPGDAGDVGSDIMYAGESTGMTWDTSGETAPTRRLLGWRSIAWLTKETSSKKTTGNNRSGSDPCGYYGGSDTYYCHQIEGDSRYYTEDHDYYKHDSYVVPDHTGSKFCLSFGYYYQFWYGESTNYSSFSSLNFTYNNKDYWRVYDASCRTIAKKPSVAIWNGSLMTNGGVKTSLSQRHDTNKMNAAQVGGNNEIIPTDRGGSQTLYGSWTEHLDVVGRKSSNHGSGASLARGSGKLSICDNVDLTIANTNCSDLGWSGVNNDTSYLSKLETYLKNDPQFEPSSTYNINYLKDLPSSDDVMGHLHEGMSGTTIVRYSGDLTINHNITTVPGPYSSIYEIPQVILFVDGKVNITSDVKRIDAWIIARDEINTCSSPDFERRKTQARVYGVGEQPCSNQLVINGPVRASKLILNRSFGSDPIAGYNGTFGERSAKESPAEIFNFRADVYLWAYAQSGRYKSSYNETYSRELPPRY